ncbi:MAG: MBL fold metallo-hydrolase [Brachybacterium sp.]|nr:MBL fold metallo-hydrolase [Brachybacterium sp.]
MTLRLICRTAPNPGPMTLAGTNTYVLRDAGRGIIIDPGPSDPEHLHAILEDVGRCVGILLTHRHADHVEAVPALQRLLAERGTEDVPVWANDADAAPGATAPPDRLFLRGDDAPASAEVIALPGHTADSLGVLTADGDLVSGDTLLGGSSTVIVPPDGDLTAYLASLERLAALAEAGRIRALRPGHGRPDVGAGRVTAVITDALDHRRRRIDQVRRLHEDGTTEAEQIAAEVYGSALPEALRRSALWNVEAALRHLGLA